MTLVRNLSWNAMGFGIILAQVLGVVSVQPPLLVFAASMLSLPVMMENIRPTRELSLYEELVVEYTTTDMDALTFVLKAEELDAA